MNPTQIDPNSANLPLIYLGFTLLILLTLAAALVKAILMWRRGRYTQGFRMILGLTLLLLTRLAVFLVTYFAWQTSHQFTPGLLALDQACSLIAVMLISWLWNFPERSRVVDITLLALSLLAAALAAFQLIGSAVQLGGTACFWQGLSITLGVISIGLILLRKPNLWHYGLFTLAILLIGSILSCASGSIDVLHLAHLVSFPLLLALGDRFPISDTIGVELSEEEQLGRRRFSVEHRLLAIIQQLFDANDPTGILYKIAQTTAYLILADLTMVIDTPDQNGKIRVIAGYDLIREEPLQAITLDSKSIPLITNYMERGKILHIPASSTSRDLTHLAKILQLSKPGHLLASPIYVAGADKTIGVILFSPFSNRPWTKEDQDYIQLLCKLFESAFNHHLVTQNGDSAGVKNTIRDLTAKLAQLSQDKHKLREDIAVLSKEHQNLILDQGSLQKKYELVMSWSNGLQRHLAMLVDLSKKQSNEALRKYIGVVEKEVGQAKEVSEAVGEAEGEIPPAEEVVPVEAPDPDSIRPASLNEAIISCLKDAHKEIASKGLTTTLDLPENPPLLKMNHALFKEVISFLIANAILENPPETEIRIRTQIYKEDHTQQFAHIKISDQGKGYYPNEIAKILNDHLTSEQQEQLSQVMTNLYVTKNLVENEGGRMWVESTPGTGTTVSLLLVFL